MLLAIITRVKEITRHTFNNPCNKSHVMKLSIISVRRRCHVNEKSKCVERQERYQMPCICYLWPNLVIAMNQMMIVWIMTMLETTQIRTWHVCWRHSTNWMLVGGGKNVMFKTVMQFCCQRTSNNILFERGHPWQHSWGGSHWFDHFLLSTKHLHNNDHLEMAINSNNSQW